MLLWKSLIVPFYRYISIFGQESLRNSKDKADEKYI